MSLYQKLQLAKSEEDVKDIYIQALWLKNQNKGLVDIQTKEIWFEAKLWWKKSTYEMFSQLLRYVDFNLRQWEGLPPFLCVIDSRKAAIMKTSDAIPLLEKKFIKRGKSWSHVLPEVVDIVSAYIGTYIISFNIQTHEEEFISTVKTAVKTGLIVRTQITPDNLKQVFDKRVEMIWKEIKGISEDNYSLLFFADIMHDWTVSTHANLPAELLHKWDAPVFSLAGNLYELGNKEWYRRFWSIYSKPPKQEYRDYLLERRDSLIPLDERSFKWAFYTPLHVVDKAYDKLTETLGKNRQKEYVVRDMCCGVGNLEVKHSNPRNIYMSTLDQPDIDVMKATKTCVAATRFQYDYLNDDVTDEGNIDYNLTNKLPEWLRQAIEESRKWSKKILVLINPPYAEAMNSDNRADNSGAESKKWVQETKVAKYLDKQGYATRELFVQFLVRIAKEIPGATLAMFSTLKYVNAPNFEKFREYRNAKYLNWFIVPSKSFEWLKGDFPIGFLIRSTNNASEKKMVIQEISAEIIDKEAKPIWEKTFYNIPNNKLLSEWIVRPRSNKVDCIPLKNAVTPAATSKDLRWSKRSDWAIWSMMCKGNDFQNASMATAIFSSWYCSAWAFFINPQNLWQAAVIFSVRRLIKPTRINDRDQFLQPNCELPEAFKNDCLVWMLFNGSNLTASAHDLERNGKKWSIVNHFIPYTESEVGSYERFESDFMVQYMSDKTFSAEAQKVLEAGKTLRKTYFEHIDPHSVREELKLNRSDVGWYQIRNALKRRNESWDFAPISFVEYDESYRELSEKLRPKVYEYEFLKV